MALLFNMLSISVITFPPRGRRLLTSWLWMCPTSSRQKIGREGNSVPRRLDQEGSYLQGQGVRGARRSGACSPRERRSAQRRPTARDSQMLSQQPAFEARSQTARSSWQGRGKGREQRLGTPAPWEQRERRRVRGRSNSEESELPAAAGSSDPEAPSLPTRFMRKEMSPDRRHGVSLPWMSPVLHIHAASHVAR